MRSVCAKIDKMDFTVEFVSRNLVTQSNFVEFRDDQNFTFFKALGVESHMKWCHMA